MRRAARISGAGAERILATVAACGAGLLLAVSGSAAGASEAPGAPCSCASAAASPALPPQFSFAAVGDIIIQRPMDDLIPARAPQIARELRRADVSFGNFESNSFALEGFTGKPRTHPDGFVLLAPPSVPRELASLGFTLVSVANNHAGDWGPQGMLATARTLREAGIASAGTGADLAAARAAVCVRAKQTTVALIAATSTFAAEHAASAERPGVNALHLIPHSGTDEVDDTDRRALLASIRAARRAAAFVIVSLHTHEAGADPQRPPPFEVRVAHDALDAGADVFVAHGPHELRGIEIYRGRPIFYSLGNFAVEQPLPRINPHPASVPAGSVFTQRAFFESVLASARYEQGHLVELRLYPFELVNTADPRTHGLPEALSSAAARAILERLRTLSQPFGTQLRIADRAGVVSVRSH